DHAPRDGHEHRLDVDVDELRPRNAGCRADRLAGHDLRPGPADPGVPAAGAAAARPPGRAAPAQRSDGAGVPDVAAAPRGHLRYPLTGSLRGMSKQSPTLLILRSLSQRRLMVVPSIYVEPGVSASLPSDASDPSESAARAAIAASFTVAPTTGV